VDFTPDSQSPPKWGEEGGMNCQVTPSLANEDLT